MRQPIDDYSNGSVPDFLSKNKVDVAYFPTIGGDEKPVLFRYIRKQTGKVEWNVECKPEFPDNNIKYAFCRLVELAKLPKERKKRVVVLVPSYSEDMPRLIKDIRRHVKPGIEVYQC